MSADPSRDDLRDDKVEIFEVDDEKVAVNATKVEEKVSAFACLQRSIKRVPIVHWLAANKLAAEMKQHFAPWIEQTGKVISANLNNKYSEEVRAAAALAVEERSFLDHLE